MKILISGKPGSGKSTIVRSLHATDLDSFGHHPDGDYDRWIVSVDAIKERMRKGGIFAGICSNIDEIAALPWDLKIWLRVPVDVLISRYAKDDSRKRKRKIDWAYSTVMPKGDWHIVNANRHIRDVILNILRLIK